jgi:hypothetical protein
MFPQFKIITELSQVMLQHEASPLTTDQINSVVDSVCLMPDFCGIKQGQKAEVKRYLIECVYNNVLED